jgi:hypothetical protein
LPNKGDRRQSKRTLKRLFAVDGGMLSVKKNGT